jgi:hypothetical protein
LLYISKYPFKYYEIVCKNKYLLYSLIKLYERCIRFVNNVTITIPDHQMTNIKVFHFQKS